ncbi:ferritin-like fold-containing protein [Georgenia subflava]|uniref:Hydroxylase n=1 Tax=Georgenia subflava TaxID=1622177 RepID=A0A6N7EQQ2_9MICO|nr:ferritin-like fold-containing protein [Georgenia subflava]MPV38845.1 hydroxylase [Georgenia subflava]
MPPSSETVPVAAPAVVELLGLHARVQLAAFTQLAGDAWHAPDLPGQVTLARMAAGELAPLDQLERHVRELDADLYAVMDGYTGLLGDLDVRTPPGDWSERLVRTYVVYGMLADLQRALTVGLGPTTAEVVAEVLADNGYADFVVAVLGPVVAQDPQLGARLGLWGRRVVGEALGIVQRVLADHPLLVTFLAESETGDDVDRLRNQLAGGHARRMERLALKS